MASPLRLVREAVESSLAPAPDDKLLVDYMLAVIASNFWPGGGDPLWGWIIGPPGSMKTEVARSLDGHHRTYFLSSLTPSALISGYEKEDGSDPSIVKDWDRNVVVIKEFTSIIQLPDAHVRQIFGDLRSVYDGCHGKAFGTVGLRRYTNLRFSLLACVTPAIDKYTLVHTDLGERFVGFRLARGGTVDFRERQRIAEHVWTASATKETWRQAIRYAMHAALDSFANGDFVMPEIIDQHKTTLIALADLLSLLRSVPQDDYAPMNPEIASRTVQQVKMLACGRCLADGRESVTADDVNFVRRVVFDTLPVALSSMITTIAAAQSQLPADQFLSVKWLSRQTALPVAWLTHVVRQYGFCGLFQRSDMAIRCSDELLRRFTQTGFLLASRHHNGVG